MHDMLEMKKNKMEDMHSKLMMTKLQDKTNKIMATLNEC